MSEALGAGGGSGFAPEALSQDAFLGGRIALLQPRRGYRAAIDPVLLAAFVPARPGESALDLGCGAGAAALCLAARVPGLDLHGLEMQADYADLARRNAAANGLALKVHEGDLRAMPAALRAASFDHVLMNPPYQRGGTPSPDAGRDAAHRETAAPLALWLDAGIRRLKPGGWLALVHRADRLGEILAAMRGRIGAVDLLPVAARRGRIAGRVLLRGRKGSRAGLALHPPLVLHAGPAHGGDGDDHTEDARRILREAASLLPDTR